MAVLVNWETLPGQGPELDHYEWGTIFVVRNESIDVINEVRTVLEGLSYGRVDTEGDFTVIQLDTRPGVGRRATQGLVGEKLAEDLYKASVRGRFEHPERPE